GAMDYVLKDRLARLPVAVLSALQEKRLRDERQRAIDDLAKKVEELAPIGAVCLRRFARPARAVAHGCGLHPAPGRTLASKNPQNHSTAEKQVNEWLFSITDNGNSIAREYCQHIFVRFKRLHTRTEYPGNGIGLAICRKIIEQNGGRIWVTSQEGGGSTFKF